MRQEESRHRAGGVILSGFVEKADGVTATATNNLISQAIREYSEVFQARFEGSMAPRGPTDSSGTGTIPASGSSS